MKRRVVVVGAGVGGLTAAVRLAQQDFEVHVFEARVTSGGLASRQSVSGFDFEAGPYILLDRAGLEWAFAEIGLSLAEQIPLQRVAQVYEVTCADGPTVRIHDSLDETAAGLELHWPGSGDAYRRFVQQALSVYHRLQPLQRVSKMTLRELLRSGVWREIPFLLSSLESVLRRTGLPEQVLNTIGIWTHVAGQARTMAPSPLALIPALIHHAGAWYPTNGIGTIPEKLTDAALRAGVHIHFETRVTAIRSDSKVVSGIDIAGTEFIPADAVIADAHGVGTYLELLQGRRPSIRRRARKKLEKLPLQSPGVCAYMAVQGHIPTTYLRFRLPPAN
jgi:phytoene desaturase